MFVHIHALFVCYDDDNYAVLKAGLELKLHFVKQTMLVYMYFVQSRDILLLALYRIMMHASKIEDG